MHTNKIILEKQRWLINKFQVKTCIKKQRLFYKKITAHLQTQNL